MELKSLDGSRVRIPQDFSGKWIVIEFQSGDTGRSYLQSYASFARKRLTDDVIFISAYFDVESKTATNKHEEWLQVLNRRRQKSNPFKTLLLPDGIAHPIFRQLGMNEEDRKTNMVIIQPNGKIAATISGMSMHGFGSGMKNIIEWGDEKMIDALLAKKDLEGAKQLALNFAPMVNQAGSKNRISIPHLRSRTKVHLASGNLQAAEADANKVYAEAMKVSKYLNMRTDDLETAEQLKEAVEKARNTMR